MREFDAHDVDRVSGARRPVVDRVGDVDLGDRGGLLERGLELVLLHARPNVARGVARHE